MLRRSLLTTAAVVFALPALPRLAKAAAMPDRQILHVLDRLAFGASEKDFARLKRAGIDRYIAEQLDPQGLTEPPELTARLAQLETLRLDPIELFQRYGPRLAGGGPKPSPEEIKARREAARIIVREASEARVLRALYSSRQLEQVMVDFWFNHFNIFAEKGLDHLWVGAYEETAIRPHALGRFADLLRATARHPAMLFYLDNWENSAPGSKMPNGREAGINENYARELMELHTLGVDGGYTQADVVALAEILTGWGLLRPRMPPPDRSGFYFDLSRHQWGEKRFLGHDIQPAGVAEGAEALDILAKSPATARRIASKLAQYFVADAPPAALVERLASRFRESDGDIRAVLQALFASPEFRGSVGGKFKSPYRYVLSAVRAAGVEVKNPRPLLGTMARLGQPLYHCATPDGFRDSEDAWLSPDATVTRVNFATALASGRLPLRAAQEGQEPVVEISASGGAPVDAATVQNLLGPAIGQRTRAAVDGAPTELRAALVLGSPDFMRR
jgi:uncharacterized protein (DUF1800 family)